MINMRKLQSPKGEYNQVVIKEYKDSKKTFYKITYHRYLKNSGIELDEDSTLSNNRVITSKIFDNICFMHQENITLENIDEVFKNQNLVNFIDDNFSSYSLEQVKEYLEKLELGKSFNTVKRARETIFEYASCNDFDYFMTLTIDDKKQEHSKSLDELYPIISQWFRDYKKKHKDFTYLLVPEPHKKEDEDGLKRWHFHGLVKGIPKEDLIQFSEEHKGSKYINKRVKKGDVLYDWKNWYKRFGFNDIEPIKDKKAVEKYITKYVVKELGQNIKKPNSHLYYCSKGLKKAQIIAKGTYSFKVDADDKDFFDYVGDYCSCKTVENLAELEQLKEILIQKNYTYIDNLKIDKDTGEVLS